MEVAIRLVFAALACNVSALCVDRIVKGISKLIGSATTVGLKNTEKIANIYMTFDIWSDVCAEFPNESVNRYNEITRQIVNAAIPPAQQTHQFKQMMGKPLSGMMRLMTVLSRCRVDQAVAIRYTFQHLELMAALQEPPTNIVEFASVMDNIASAQLLAKQAKQRGRSAQDSAGETSAEPSEQQAVAQGWDCSRQPPYL